MFLPRCEKFLPRYVLLLNDKHSLLDAELAHQVGPAALASSPYSTYSMYSLIERTCLRTTLGR
jgi:hypothetical protein